MPNSDQWCKRKTWMLCQSVFESWEDVSRQSLAWIQVSWGLKPTFKGKLEHESSPSSYPRSGSWPYNSVIINFLHLTSLYQAFFIIVSSLQNHNENLLTYTMTSFKHVEKFRTDLFGSNLVWVLEFVMLIYDNNMCSWQRILWLHPDTKFDFSSPYTEFSLNTQRTVTGHSTGVELLKA